MYILYTYLLFHMTESEKSDGSNVCIIMNSSNKVIPVRPAIQHL